MTLRYVAYTIISVAFSFLIHEFAHWIVGELLGNEMKMTLNTGYPVAGRYVEAWHYPVVSAAGPLITLLQSIIFFFLIRRFKDINLFPFLFSPFYLELLSGVMNIRNPNDLGRIGQYLNIGLFTLPILFCMMHVMLLYITAKREEYNKKMIILTVVLTIVVSSIWILTNQKFKVILI